MKHSITYTGTDWLLKIWEPAAITGNRELPFLYKVKLRFPTEQAAKETWEHYKVVNRHILKKDTDNGKLVAV